MAYLDQYQLALEDEFGRRITAAIVYASTQVMAEAASVTGHEKRTELAYRVLNDPHKYTLPFAFAVASNATITAASTDNDIAFTVNSVWNGMAGVIL